MPFNTLLLNCLIPRTSFNESGGEVSVTPEKNEVVLFFITDSEIVRQNLNMQGKICDCLIFYAKKGQMNKVLCLVESKGTKLEHAKEQIINTYRQLNRLLEHSSSRNQLSQITWKAYICTHGQAPKEVLQCANELKKVFGKNNSSIARASDLGSFLRK